MTAHGVHGVAMRFMSYMGGFVENIWRGWGKFSSHARFEIEDDCKIRFLKDKLYGDQVLKDIFPDLFCIDCVKDASMENYLVVIQ